MIHGYARVSTDGQSVAAQIATPLLERSVGWRALLPAAPAPPPLAAASASFQAAHWMSQFFPTPDAPDLEARLRGLLRAAIDAAPSREPGT